MRLATARLLRLARKANFDPSQPRLPRGGSSGGRWTDGGDGAGGSPRRSTGEPVRLAQARGGRGATPTVRLGTSTVPVSPAQAMRYEEARIRAEREVARLRAVPGNENWKPPTGAYSTVEGAILQQEATVNAAIAYRYGRIGHNSGAVAPLRSGDNGPTMEIIRSSDSSLIDKSTKFHRGPK